MRPITQVRLSGFGGQGVVLAGVLLGQAGALDGRFVAGSNSYGAQARGSGCKAEIVLSDNPIDFPHLIVADILVAMSQGGYEQYAPDVRPASGLILFDQGQVKPKEDLPLRQLAIPATSRSIKFLKSKQAANMVFLGALIGITNILSVRAMQRAIRLHIPEGFRKLNLEALKIGLNIGRQIRG
jgi:2-oxoglutarate ferredoxin oxidoreductase subunit gamma